MTEAEGRRSSSVFRRLNKIGIVGESRDTAIPFFAELGLTLEKRVTIERLKLSRFLSSLAVVDHRNAPVNALGSTRHVHRGRHRREKLARLGTHGAELVGEVVRGYLFLRGREELLIGLAEHLGFRSPPAHGYYERTWLWQRFT